MKDADLAQLPADFGVMDYISTQQSDYRNPFPSVTKPVSNIQLLLIILTYFILDSSEAPNIFCISGMTDDRGCDRQHANSLDSVTVVPL